MPNDRDKLISIIKSLDSDYNDGRISAEKYSYFRSKYEDKLNEIDAKNATKRIRSMQGKPSSSNNKKRSKKPTNNKKNKEQDLVQKYIINPKKGDNSLKTKREPMDTSTFGLLLLLILVIGFTVGVSYGIFYFDFDSLSETTTVAVVDDTAFPEIQSTVVKNATTNSYSGNSSTSTTSSSYDGGVYADDSASYSSSSYSSDSNSYYSESSQGSSYDSNSYYSEQSGSSYEG